MENNDYYEGKIRISLCLKPEIHEQAKRHAKDCGLSFSALVEQLLRQQIGAPSVAVRKATTTEPAAQ